MFLAPTSIFGQSSVSTSSSDDAPQVLLEAVTVTGSNIRRVDAETALPVTVLNRSDIEMRAGSTGADLFASLTMSEPPGINESKIGSQGARGDVTSIDLRGIGAGSTLMLINGRRMAPHPLTGNENGVPSLAPNANVIPTALIDRIEVLRDGASAIYGADAAAGVINSIISRDGEGGSIALSTALTQHGGAEEYRFTASDGFTTGKTHFSVSLDYFHREDMASNERAWGEDTDLRVTRNLPAPWDGLPVTDPATGNVLSRENDMDNSSSITNYGQFRRGFIQDDFLTFNSSAPDNNAGISNETAPANGVATTASNGRFFFYPTADGSVNFKQSTPSRNLENQEHNYYHNRMAHRVLIPALDRVNVALFADHRLNEHLSLFGDVFYSGSQANTVRESANMQNVNEPGIYVPAANPYNPFGTSFYHPTGEPNADGSPRITGTPADVTIISGTMPAGIKDRFIQVDSHYFRALGGLRGRFGEGWQWESGAMYSGARSHETEENIFRESLLRRALNRTDSTAYNPFPATFKIENDLVVVDQLYINPDTVTEPMYDTDNRYGETELLTWDLKADGELWRLFEGGRIKIAGGTEVRWESYDSWKAPFAGLNPPGSGADFPYLRENDNDFIAMSPNATINASQTIYSAYAEIAFPFVTSDNRLPLVEELELSVAGRYEDFSIHGQSTKPKASLVWRPATWLKFRTSYNESFRAPNLAQTDTTPLLRVSYSDDPYRSEVTGALSDLNSPRRTFRQGNASLEPETAKSWVAGVVVDVPPVQGLSLTLDYWEMEQDNAISSIGVPDTLELDQLFLDLATQEALAAGTPIDQVDLGSGTGTYAGYGRVTRRPLTEQDRADFAAYNAAQPSAETMRAPVGELESLINDYINLGSRRLSGVELGFQYVLPATDLGRFVLKGEATHYLKRDEELDRDGLVVSQLGKNGRAEWRGNLGLSWNRGRWTSSWFTSYYGEFADTSASTTETHYNVLGQPDDIKVMDVNGITRYYLRVKPAILHNLLVNYRFSADARGWLRGVTVQAGINNVFDTWPPVADQTETFHVGTVNPRGRQFTLKLERTF